MAMRNWSVACSIDRQLAGSGTPFQAAHLRDFMGGFSRRLFGHCAVTGAGSAASKPWPFAGPKGLIVHSEEKRKDE
jgi:hypothetical protein